MRYQLRNYQFYQPCEVLKVECYLLFQDLMIFEKKKSTETDVVGVI